MLIRHVQLRQSVRQTQMMMTNQSPTMLAIIMKKKMILIMSRYGLTVGITTLIKTLRENLAHHNHTKDYMVEDTPDGWIRKYKYCKVVQNPSVLMFCSNYSFVMF